MGIGREQSHDASRYCLFIALRSSRKCELFAMSTEAYNIRNRQPSEPLENHEKIQNNSSDIGDSSDPFIAAKLPFSSAC